ncbi:hypothetical protein CRYUN_Cryun30bG0051300 [Craigia yunnanensis]
MIFQPPHPPITTTALDTMLIPLTADRNRGRRHQSHLRGCELTSGPHGVEMSSQNQRGVDFPRGSNQPHRAASLDRFRQKRKERCFDKKVRYSLRQEVALSLGTSINGLLRFEELLRIRTLRSSVLKCARLGARRPPAASRRRID